VSGDTTTNGQRKGVPNSWSGNSEAARTEICVDTGNKSMKLAKNVTGNTWQTEMILFLCSRFPTIAWDVASTNNSDRRRELR